MVWNALGRFKPDNAHHTRLKSFGVRHRSRSGLLTHYIRMSHRGTQATVPPPPLQKGERSATMLVIRCIVRIPCLEYGYG
jgi:hypothetical protein